MLVRLYRWNAAKHDVENALSRVTWDADPCCCYCCRFAPSLPGIRKLRVTETTHCVDRWEMCRLRVAGQHAAGHAACDSENRIRQEKWTDCWWIVNSISNVLLYVLPETVDKRTVNSLKVILSFTQTMNNLKLTSLLFVYVVLTAASG